MRSAACMHKATDMQYSPGQRNTWPLRMGPKEFLLSKLVPKKLMFLKFWQYYWHQAQNLRSKSYKNTFQSATIMNWIQLVTQMCQSTLKNTASLHPLPTTLYLWPQTPLGRDSHACCVTNFMPHLTPQHPQSNWLWLQYFTVQHLKALSSKPTCSYNSEWKCKHGNKLIYLKT